MDKELEESQGLRLPWLCASMFKFKQMFMMKYMNSYLDFFVIVATNMLTILIYGQCFKAEWRKGEFPPGMTRNMMP